MHNEWNAFRHHIELRGGAKETHYRHEETGVVTTYSDPRDAEWEHAHSDLVGTWTRQSFAESHGYRGMTLREFFVRKEEIEGMPLLVRLVVPEAPEWSYTRDLYQPRMPNDEHGDQLYPPLLIVQIVPLPGFPDLMGPNGKIPEGTVDYHISLCFTNELGRFDLYNWNDGVRQGLAVHEGLRERWDGKEAVARVWIATGGAATVLSLTVEQEGDMMEDPVVMAMHNAGRFWDRPVHISL